MAFRDAKTLRKSVSVHASVTNHFNQDRHLSRAIFGENRGAALAEWRLLSAA